MPIERPYVVLSCAMTLDGSIDDTTERRLLLSNEADFDRVDDLRASCDAILVGANTIRRDDPRLTIRSADRRTARVDDGREPNPVKVTLTASGDLDPSAKFFTADGAAKLVYCQEVGLARTRHRLRDLATIIDAGPTLDLGFVVADLWARGVRRLLVEGGSTIHAQFLAAGFVDEVQLVVAPLLLGDREAPRFAGSVFGRLDLADVRRIGDRVLLRYLVPDSGQADGERQPIIQT